DDVDWTKLAAIAAAAPAALSMPEGKITGIELSKPDNPIGRPIILLKIEVTDPNRESGFVITDASGTIKQVMPPKSRRKTVDYYDPATIIETFGRLSSDFGQSREYAEITFFNDKVVIVMADHMQPNSFSQVILNEDGLQRIGTPAMSAVKNVPFHIA